MQRGILAAAVSSAHALMLTVDRYLLREFAMSIAATTVVLLFVTMGVELADTLAEIAGGKIPVSLLVSQLGLRSLRWLPLLLPLGLFLGLLLCIGRLYRDSEMAVLASVGRGPRDLLRPVMWIAAPGAMVVAISSIWAGPSAQHAARAMIADANRSLVIAGLEAGRFRELPGGQGILYVTELSADGSQMTNVFLQSDRKGRMDVVTARSGLLFLDAGQRYLRLTDGVRIDGVPGQKDYRVMHYRRNEIRLPINSAPNTIQDATSTSTLELLANPKPDARAELHWRVATPIAALLLAVLAIPLARAEPRQPRYWLLMMALTVYVLYTALLLIGRGLLATGKLTPWAGLWWLHLPMLALALWMLHRDGNLRMPRVARA